MKRSIVAAALLLLACPDARADDTVQPASCSMTDNTLANAQSCSDAGFAAMQRSDFSGAVPFLSKTHNILLAQFGASDKDTLGSYSNLAVALHELGKYGEAERIDRQVAEARVSVVGPENPDTLTSFNNLALDLAAQDRPEEAEPIARRVYETRLRMLPPDDPRTLDTLENLADDVQLQGRDCIDLEGRCIAVSEVHQRIYETLLRTSGPDDPGVLQAHSGVAWDLKREGRWADAEQIDREIYEVQARQLGAENPFTLTSLGLLATDMQYEGRPADAEPLLLRLVAAQEARGEGETNPSTILFRGILGVLRAHDLRKYAEGYPDIKAAAEGVRLRYAETLNGWALGGSGDPAKSQDTARTLLETYRWVFLGQIEAAWGWSHER